MPNTSKQPTDSVHQAKHEKTPKSGAPELGSQAATTRLATEGPKQSGTTDKEHKTGAFILSIDKPTGIGNNRGTDQNQLSYVLLLAMTMLALFMSSFLALFQGKQRSAKANLALSTRETSTKGESYANQLELDSGHTKTGFPNIWENNKGHALDPRAFDASWYFEPRQEVFIRNQKVLESFKNKEQEFTSFISEAPGDELRIGLERFLQLVADRTPLEKFKQNKFAVETMIESVDELQKLYRILQARGLSESARHYQVIRFKTEGIASQRLQALRIYGLLIPFNGREYCEIVLFDPNHQVLGINAARRHGTDFRSTSSLKHQLRSALTHEAKRSILRTKQAEEKWYHPVEEHSYN